jgi:hypothetical protein
MFNLLIVVAVRSDVNAVKKIVVLVAILVNVANVVKIFVIALEIVVKLVVISWRLLLSLLFM